jgi:hypothetical protein
MIDPTGHCAKPSCPIGLTGPTPCPVCDKKASPEPTPGTESGSGTSTGSGSSSGSGSGGTEPSVTYQSSGEAMVAAYLGWSYVESFWYNNYQWAMWDAQLPIGDIALLLGTAGTILYVGGDYLVYVIGNSDMIANGVSNTFSGGASSMPPEDPEGFKKFEQLKRYLGSAGKGREWHHIVEQSQIEKSGFSEYLINNTHNIINVDARTHRLISGYYSSSPAWLPKGGLVGWTKF